MTMRMENIHLGILIVPTTCRPTAELSMFMTDIVKDVISGGIAEHWQVPREIQRKVSLLLRLSHVLTPNRK